MRRYLRAGLGALSLVVVGAAGGLSTGALVAPAPAGATVAMGTTSGGLVSPDGTSHTDFPDPTVTYSGSGDTYYAYATGTTFYSQANWASGGIGVTTLSCNTAGCQDQSSRTVARSRTGTPVTLTAKFGLQAPSVVYLDGRWVMYYGGVYAPSGTLAFGIYDSTSSNPTSGFTSPVTEQPLMYQASTGGSTDPSVFISPSGQPWFQWKTSTYTNDGVPAHLWSMRLTTDGTQMLPGASAYILATQPTSGWASYTIENPQMVWSGGTYYLFYSGGLWNSTGYGEGYTTCTGPTGGCGTPGTHEILSSSTSGTYGPGGGSLFTTTTGQWLMAFHSWSSSCASYTSPCDGVRQLFVRPVSGLFSTSLPNISSFTASPSSLPSTGGSVTLTASATRAVSYTFTASPAVNGLPVTVHMTGSAQAIATLPANNTSSTESYTFTVTATGPYGGQARSSVRVTEPPFSAPSLVMQGTSSPDIAAEGPNNSLVYYWWDGSTGSFQSITVAGANTTYSTPSMVMQGTSSPDIAAEGPNNSLVYYWWDGSTGSFQSDQAS